MLPFVSILSLITLIAGCFDKKFIVVLVYLDESTKNYAEELRRRFISGVGNVVKLTELGPIQLQDGDDIEAAMNRIAAGNSVVPVCPTMGNEWWSWMVVTVCSVNEYRQQRLWFSKLQQYVTLSHMSFPRILRALLGMQTAVVVIGHSGPSSALPDICDSILQQEVEVAVMIFFSCCAIRVRDGNLVFAAQHYPNIIFAGMSSLVSIESANVLLTSIVMHLLYSNVPPHPYQPVRDIVRINIACAAALSAQNLQHADSSSAAASSIADFAALNFLNKCLSNTMLDLSCEIERLQSLSTPLKALLLNSLLYRRYHMWSSSSVGLSQTETVISKLKLAGLNCEQNDEAANNVLIHSIHLFRLQLLDEILAFDSDLLSSTLSSFSSLERKMLEACLTGLVSCELKVQLEQSLLSLACRSANRNQFLLTCTALCLVNEKGYLFHPPQDQQQQSTHDWSPLLRVDSIIFLHEGLDAVLFFPDPFAVPGVERTGIATVDIRHQSGSQATSARRTAFVLQQNVPLESYMASPKSAYLADLSIFSTYISTTPRNLPIEVGNWQSLVRLYSTNGKANDSVTLGRVMVELSPVILFTVTPEVFDLVLRAFRVYFKLVTGDAGPVTQDHQEVLNELHVVEFSNESDTVNGRMKLFPTHTTRGVKFTFAESRVVPKSHKSTDLLECCRFVAMKSSSSLSVFFTDTHYGQYACVGCNPGRGPPLTLKYVQEEKGRREVQNQNQAVCEKFQFHPVELWYKEPLPQ